MAICCNCGKEFNLMRTKKAYENWCERHNMYEANDSDPYYDYNYINQDDDDNPLCLECAKDRADSLLSEGRAFMEECAPYNGYDED